MILTKETIKEKDDFKLFSNYVDDVSLIHRARWRYKGSKRKGNKRV